MKSNTLRVATAFAFTLMLGAGQAALAVHTGDEDDGGPPPGERRGVITGVSEDGFVSVDNCEIGDYVTLAANEGGDLYLQCAHFPGGGPCPKGQYVILHHHDGPACAKWTGQMNKPNG